MEPDGRETVLAANVLTNLTEFQFTMIGGEANDPGLVFKKQ